MNISVTIEMQDLYRMLRHIHFGQYPKRSVLYPVFSVVCMAASVFVLFNPQIPIRNFWFIGIVPMMYFVVVPFFMIFLAQKIIKTQTAYNHPFYYYFDETGIKAKNKQSEEKIEWRRFVKVSESAQDFVFYLSKVHAFSIPKKQVSEKKEQIRAFIREHMPPEKADLHIK